MKLIKVDPSEVNNLREGTRGRVSYPILKGFLESDAYLMNVELGPDERTPSSMCGLLKLYLQRHPMPVKPFTRSGKLYLVRLDIDENGKAIKNWEQKLVDRDDDFSTKAATITPEVVDQKG